MAEFVKAKPPGDAAGDAPGDAPGSARVRPAPPSDQLDWIGMGGVPLTIIDTASIPSDALRYSMIGARVFDAPRHHHFAIGTVAGVEEITTQIEKEISAAAAIGITHEIDILQQRLDTKVASEQAAMDDLLQRLSARA